MASATDFKKHNIRGGLTYSNLVMAHAITNNDRSNFPKAPEKIAPDAQLLVDQTQFDRLAAHIRDTYLPEAKARSAKGEKKDAFDDKQIKKFLAALEEQEFDGAPFLPFKPVYHKTKEAAPWAVATVKFTGTAGVDIKQLARVNSEDELLVPDPATIQFPTIKPIGQTVHKLYPGAWCYATLNLSGYVQSSSNFGISAYANDIVFLEDRDRLGGGGAELDEDDIFLED